MHTTITVDTHVRVICQRHLLRHVICGIHQTQTLVQDWLNVCIGHGHRGCKKHDRNNWKSECLLRLYI